MNVKLATTTLAAVLLVPFVQAQAQGTAAPAAAPTKVGVLSVRQAIVNTAEGKLASAELQSQFAPRQTELENIRKELEDIQKRLQAPAVSDEEKDRLRRRGEGLQRAFQRKQQELQDDLQAAEGEIGDRIGRKLMEVVDRYARENGYAAIFDFSAQGTNVVYASNQVDITQDAIRLYDQANPVKSAAPQPGTPKPTPGTARPPAQKPPQQ